MCVCIYLLDVYTCMYTSNTYILENIYIRKFYIYIRIFFFHSALCYEDLYKFWNRVVNYLFLMLYNSLQCDYILFIHSVNNIFQHFTIINNTIMNVLYVC